MRAGDGFAALAKITPRSTAQLESKCISPNTESVHKDILFLASKTTLCSCKWKKKMGMTLHLVLQTALPPYTHTLSLLLFQSFPVPHWEHNHWQLFQSLAPEKQSPWKRDLSFCLCSIILRLSASSLGSTSLLYIYDIPTPATGSFEPLTTGWTQMETSLLVHWTFFLMA